MHPISDVLPAPLFRVPETDLAELAALPDAARTEVSVRLQLLAQVVAARTVNGGCKAIAARMHRPGYSAKRLRTLYYEYTRGTDRFEAGDWRILVNKSSAPELSNRESLAPEAFKVFVHDFLVLNQRGKARQRYRELLERLRLWRDTGRKEYAIPGYSTPPIDVPGCDHPAGWSYARLMKLKPSKFTQTAVSIGRGAASAYRPGVATTRRELRVGQIYMFDDQVHDIRVNFIGNQRKVQRPLELVAMDCFSGCFVAHGFKPTTLADDGARIMLRQEDMVWFALHWLQNIGWREDTGTQVIAEHGTAKFPEWLVEKIQEHTGGKITFAMGGVDRRPAFMGQFQAPARGNFKIKAGLESSFNLVRNEMASMPEFPGQVGRNRDSAPEEWEARMRHNELLLQATQAMSAPARMPFLEWNEFMGKALDNYAKINNRTWHDLEGWLEAGLVAKEWRLSPDSPWLPVAQLNALPERAAVDAVLAGDPSLMRLRKLSPREVWDGGRAELTRAPGHWVALLLPREYGAERKVSDDHVFEFEDQEMGHGAFRYIARLASGHWLTPRETYLTHVNPWSPNTLHVSDAGGRYLGACAIDLRVSKADIDAIHRKCGEVAKYEKELLVPVARAGAAITQRRMEDAAHNAAVLAGQARVKRPPIAETSDATFETLEDPLSEPAAIGLTQEDALDTLG